MFVTFFDTCMVSLVAIFVWRLSPWLVFFPWLVIACLDDTFLSSALTKVPSGAWFTISLAVILALFLLLWRYGKEQQWHAESEDRVPTSHYVQVDGSGHMKLGERYGNAQITSIPGFGIFLDKAGEKCPMVFSQFVQKFSAVPEVVVFFHLRPLDIPSVAPEDRQSVSRLAIPNGYRLVVRYGYNDEILSPNLGKVVFEQIHRYLVQRQEEPDRTIPLKQAESQHTEPGTTSVEDEKHLAKERCNNAIAVLENAYGPKLVFIMGKENMKIKREANIFRKALLSIFLFLRDNTREKMANLKVPNDKIVEVGFLKEL